MTLPLDPAAALTEFINRVAPYDPAPGAEPVAMIGLRTPDGDLTVAMGEHVTRALCRALAAYTDPDDRGTCLDCGSRRIDDNLQCRDCGRLHGILGEVIADHARRAGWTGEGTRA